MNAATVLDLRALAVPSRRNRATVSLERVDWTVRTGEFWIVGGPQGSEKSDLLFVLAGLAKPLDGQGTLFGQDMGAHFGDEHLSHGLRVGLVFDDARLFHHLTIAENIALPVRYHQNLRAEEVEPWVAALLQAMELTGLADHTPGEVTRGERRRAALARALALRPEVLFLENPLRGLDAAHAAWWIRTVQQLWRGHELMSGRSLTVIVTTDEFRPWQEAGALLQGAQYATVIKSRFTVTGSSTPADESPSPTAAAFQEN